MTVEVTKAEPKGRVRRGEGPVGKAARAVAAKLELAWNRNSGEALAALFTERGDYVPHGGGLVSGRAAVKDAFERAFAAGWARSRSEFRLLRIKPLADTVVLAMLGQKLTVLDGEVPRERMLRTTALLREIGGEWKIVLLQSTAVQPRPANGAAGDSGEPQVGDAEVEADADEPGGKAAK